MGYQENTKYATRDSYLDFSGMDLDFEIKGSQTDNKTRAVEIFIRQVTEKLYDYMDEHFEMDDETWDDSVFTKAIHHQIDYIRRNGDISVKAVNDNKVLAPNALRVLRNAAMANLPNQVKRRYRRWR